MIRPPTKSTRTYPPLHYTTLFLSGARHLTSARSDIIANRQIDVWEIAYVWAYPVALAKSINHLEAQLFHAFHPQSQLMNGTVPPSGNYGPVQEPAQIVQVMPDDEIEERRDANQRIPRKANHT